MTTGGWFFMLGSIGTVVSLLGFCFYRVLRGPTSTDNTPPAQDIDTHDVGT